MITKVYAAVVTLLLLASLAINAVQRTTALQQDNATVQALSAQVQDLSEKLTAQTEWLKAKEQERRNNDSIVFLEDSHNFVARGLVSLGDQAIVHKEFQYTDPYGTKHTGYVYRFEGIPQLVNTATGKEILLNAIKGETIHLMKSRQGSGPDYISYYTCYTNSTHCTVLVEDTGILAD